MDIASENFEAREIAEHNGLRYIAPGTKGYRRIRHNGRFVYLNLKGKPIRSGKILARIASLVIPPAWENVWICPAENGHLQVTGFDAKGRKQYRYHTRWQQVRNETKFDRLYAFGKKLPKLRRQIRRDLRRKYLDKEKVAALALSIMEATFMRVGSTAYEKEYGSYGLTTLKNRHVRFAENNVLFRFRGKKGVQRLVALKGPSLIRLLRKVKELPGQELFQYYDSEKVLHALNSADINDYLKNHMGEHFTCKDFRTWAGCVCAIEYILEQGGAGTEEAYPQSPSLPALIDAVAGRLGNTRAVCRKYYIHPELLSRFESGCTADVLPAEAGTPEKILLLFLKKLPGRSEKSRRKAR